MYVWASGFENVHIKTYSMKIVGRIEVINIRTLNASRGTCCLLPLVRIQLGLCIVRQASNIYIYSICVEFH